MPTRKKYRRLQEWECAAVEAAYAAGEKLEALAAEFNVDISTISYAAKRAGLPRRSDCHRHSPYIRLRRDFETTTNAKEAQRIRRQLAKLRANNAAARRGAI